MLWKDTAIFESNEKHAGAIDAHHVKDWEFSVWPSDCFQATVFVNNALLYFGGNYTHLIHNLFPLTAG